MSELEQGAILVGGNFTDTYGHRQLQFEVVGEQGQLIPTEVVAANQIKGQLTLGYDTGIENESVALLQQKLGNIDERIQEKVSYFRFMRNFVIGTTVVLGTFTTGIMLNPNDANKNDFDSMPGKLFMGANALAYIGIAVGFTRHGRKQRGQELAPLLEQQKHYRTSIAALGAVATVNESGF